MSIDPVLCGRVRAILFSSIKKKKGKKKKKERKKEGEKEKKERASGDSPFPGAALAGFGGPGDDMPRCCGLKKKKRVGGAEKEKKRTGAASSQSRGQAATAEPCRIAPVIPCRLPGSFILDVSSEGKKKGKEKERREVPREKYQSRDATSLHGSWLGDPLRRRRSGRAFLHLPGKGGRHDPFLPDYAKARAKKGKKEKKKGRRGTDTKAMRRGRSAPSCAESPDFAPCLLELSKNSGRYPATVLREKKEEEGEGKRQWTCSMIRSGGAFT